MKVQVALLAVALVYLVVADTTNPSTTHGPAGGARASATRVVPVSGDPSSFNNYPMWDGSSSVGSFACPSTSTYGQIVSGLAGVSEFSFWTYAPGGFASPNMVEGYVAQWDDVSSMLVGAPLAGATSWINNAVGFSELKFDLGLTIPLDPAKTYVFFATRQNVPGCTDGSAFYDSVNFAYISSGSTGMRWTNVDYWGMWEGNWISGDWVLTTMINDPNACTAGTFSASGSKPCRNCPVGTTSGLGATSCTPCAPGSYNSVAGSATCTQCGSGTYSAGGSQACKACPINTYSGGSAGWCSNCWPGTYSLQGWGYCESCPAGTFRFSKATGCVACAAGTYSGYGQAYCDNCPHGFTSASGASSCSPCPANYYGGSTPGSCVACPVGKVSDAGSWVVQGCHY